MREINDIVEKVVAMFDVPEDFTCNGQTFRERCEAWISHALDALEQEIEEYESGQ